MACHVCIVFGGFLSCNRVVAGCGGFALVLVCLRLQMGIKVWIEKPTFAFDMRVRLGVMVSGSTGRFNDSLSLEPRLLLSR